MKRKNFVNFRSRIFIGLLSIFLLTAFECAMAQTATRVLGTLSAVNGNALTVKADSGVETSFTVTATTSLKRIEPGQKDLSTAVAMTLDELAKGDRVLVSIDATSTPATAVRIIAIKAQDLAAKQQKENEDWQKNGVGGLVKSVDGDSLEITSGVGAAQKVIKILINPTTVLKRYADNSVSYDKATIAPMSAIQAGDQLRARGTKSADNSELKATEVVSGTFLNLSGKVDAVDTTANTISFKDLATKKSITVHVGADAQMRQVPDQIAQMIAMRLKSGSSGQRSSGGQSGNGEPQATPQGQGGQRQGGGSGSGNMAGSMQQLLTRAPQVHLSDLKKGDVIMLVASGDDGHVNLITLLAGVGPLLEAPASKDLLSNWSVGGGGDASGGAQ
jgi:hypothetical protein